MGESRGGDPYERAKQLVEQVLKQLEKKWNITDSTGNAMTRVKRIRTAILPDMVAGKVTPEGRESRWRDLAAGYYVQQISHYPKGHITRGKNLPERVIETVERLQEDFTDTLTYHQPLHATIQVGEAISVGTQRHRDETGDPIMTEVRRQLQAMIDEMAAERTSV